MTKPGWIYIYCCMNLSDTVVSCLVVLVLLLSTDDLQLARLELLQHQQRAGWSWSWTAPVKIHTQS